MAFASLAMKFAKDKVQNIISGAIYMKTHEVVIGAKGEHSDLLYLHEQGVPSRNIPARPVIAPALDQKEVKDAMKGCMRRAFLQAFLLGNTSGADKELDKAGLIGENACKKYITDGDNLAPNSPVTIARKGSSIPLIDTGALLNSITHEIRGK